MTLIGITKDGKWLKADSIESIADGSWYDSQVRAVISPDSAKEIIIKDGDRIYAEPVDVISLFAWFIWRRRYDSGIV